MNPLAAQLAKAALGAGSPFSSDVPAAPKKSGGGRTVITPTGTITQPALNSSPKPLQKPTAPAKTPSAVPPSTPSLPGEGKAMTAKRTSGYTVVTPNAVNEVSAPRLQVGPGQRMPSPYTKPKSAPGPAPSVNRGPEAPPPTPQPQTPPPPDAPPIGYSDTLPRDDTPPQFVGADVPPGQAGLDAAVPTAPPPRPATPAGRPGYALPLASQTAPPPRDPAADAATAYFLQQAGPGLANAAGPAGLIALLSALGGGRGETPPRPAPPAAPAAPPDTVSAPTQTPPAAAPPASPPPAGVNQLVAAGGNLAANVVGAKGVQRAAAGSPAAARVLGKAPGGFAASLPVGFGLDALDLAGINPLGQRFGQGLIGMTGLREKGRDMAADGPLWGGLSGLTAPLTTAATGLTSAFDAGSAVRENEASRARLIENEKKFAPDGVIPADPMQKGKYFDKAPDWWDWGAGTKALGKIHDEAWQNSWVPGLNYLAPWAEAVTEGLTMRGNAAARRPG